jgi:hypothetical protein
LQVFENQMLHSINKYNGAAAGVIAGGVGIPPLLESTVVPSPVNIK